MTTSDDVPTSELEFMMRAQFGLINAIVLSDNAGFGAVRNGHIEELWQRAGGTEDDENEAAREFARLVGVQMEVDAKITVQILRHLSRNTGTPVAQLAQIFSQWTGVDRPERKE